MTDRYDALSDKQKELAEIHVQNAIDRRNGGVKITKKDMAEKVGVTDRTLRNWFKEPLFLSYLEYLSRLEMQAAMPDFVATLITNLERGQNLSTKQLDLMAKLADWMPEPKQSGTTLNVQIGGDMSLEDRIKKLEERRREVVPNVPINRRLEAEEAVFHAAD